jgi:hypothetical protein
MNDAKIAIIALQHASIVRSLGAVAAEFVPPQICCR